MQSDIVERLRQPWFTHGCAEFQLEAAAEIERLTEALRAAEERERDAVMSAYCAGATDVHNSWVEGTNGGEADFGEAASDYYSSLAGAKP